MVRRRVQSLDPLLLLLACQCRISHNAQDGLPLGLGGIVLQRNLHYGPWDFATIANRRELSSFFHFTYAEIIYLLLVHVRSMYLLSSNFESEKSIRNPIRLQRAAAKAFCNSYFSGRVIHRLVNYPRMSKRKRCALADV